MRNGIMVPVDGTRFAEAALPVAMHLARRDGVSLRLVTAWEPLVHLYDSRTMVEQWEREWEAERRLYLTDVAHRVAAVSGVPVSIEYLRGRPGEILPPVPARNGLELVVMGTHGYSPMERAALGSVADQMVRRGTAPVMLIRSDLDEPKVDLVPGPPFREILVPLDGSTLAEKALQESVLRGLGSPVALTLLRVITFPAPLMVPGGGMATEPDGRIVRAEMEAAHAYLDGVADKLASWKCPVTTEVLTAPSTWSGIVDYAQANRIDLIAMSTHGRGGAARVLLGSVADKVARTSRMPVLLFHPEKAASPWGDVERLAGQVVGMP